MNGHSLTEKIIFSGSERYGKQKYSDKCKESHFLGECCYSSTNGFFYVIWMNPFVNEISLQFANHPSVKPYEYFGGLDNWMRLRTIYLVVMLAIIIKIFLIFYTNIPGNRRQKGIYFGVFLSVIKSIPVAFSTWTLIVYPNELIILQLVNGIIGYLFFGVIVSTMLSYFNVVKISEST